MTTVTQFPDYLYLGGNYSGSMIELRVWIDTVRTAAEVAKYEDRYFSSPFPSVLEFSFPLRDPTDVTKLTNRVTGSTVNVPATFSTANLWPETSESVYVCAMNQYITNGCNNCA